MITNPAAAGRVLFVAEMLHQHHINEAVANEMWERLSQESKDEYVAFAGTFIKRLRGRILHYWARFPDGSEQRQTFSEFDTEQVQNWFNATMSAGAVRVGVDDPAVTTIEQRDEVLQKIAELTKLELATWDELSDFAKAARYIKDLTKGVSP